MSRDATPSETLQACVLARIADGAVAVDSDLRVRSLNDRAPALLGVDHGSVLGRLLLESVTDDAGSVLRPSLERAVETGTAQSWEWTKERLFVQRERGMSSEGTGIDLSHPDAHQTVRR